MATTNPVPARRGSLVGPLIILLLGVVFLVGNLRPDLSLWRLFAHYWPFLLIFWGAARLLEYAVARATTRPIPRTLSGGEVFLVVMICLIGGGFSAAERRHSSGWWWGRPSLEVLGDNFDFPVRGARPMAPNTSVVIQNLQGNVRVVGLEAQQISVTGHKSVKAFDQKGAEEVDRQTPLEITEEDGRIYVRTNQDRAPGGSGSGPWRISEELEISVPKTAALSFEGRYGDLDVKDVAGPVEVNSANAGVRISNILKDARISLRRSDVVRATQVKGDVSITGRGRDIELETIAGTVTVDGDFSGNIRLHDVAKPVRYTSHATEISMEKLPGRLEMDLGSLTANDVVGPFKMTSLSKDLRIDGFSRGLDLSTRRGDIELRNPKLPLSDIRAQSQNGNIELDLPAGAQFSLEANAGNGRVENNFGDAIQVEGWHNQDGKPVVRPGDGRPHRNRGETATKSGPGAQIRLYTDRGDITLKKAGHLESL
ncbi:MAG TPA: DUF4097 family beta strand repeat-containing protein [Bryobacterales bacterium]|nr:DUF4097 family beta strand repeat-containing protein [Bryobacterales bacterium]